MGMSASQARLVQLTARMSDVEYEGQQINQQRLALSNKMSDIYSQLQDMDVPTPPSPYNFYEKNYSAKVNGEEIFVTPKEDGKFSMQVPREDDGLEAKNNPVEAGSKKVPEEAKDVPSASGIKDAKSAYDKAAKAEEDAKQKMDAAEDAYDKRGTRPASTDDKYINKTQLTQDQAAWDASTDPNKGARPTSTDDKYINKTKLAEDQTAWDAKETDKNAAQAAHTEAHNTTVAAKTALDKAKADYKSGILNHNPQFYSDANCKNAVTVNNFKEDGTLNVDTLYTLTAEKETIGSSNGNVYTIEDAKKEFGGKNNTNFDNLIKALDNHLRDETGNSDSHYGDWKIVVNGDSFEVYKAVTNGGKTAYQEFTPGKETVYVSSEVTPTLNVDGSPASYKDEATGKTIYLSEKSTLNNDAYNAATNEYLADKAIYDHEQDRLNAETSKIQAKDKKLELKLKRLDTERNALNTEIEAVKKVIQDSTEKGFKTFSG